MMFSRGFSPNRFRFKDFKLMTSAFYAVAVGFFILRLLQKEIFLCYFHSPLFSCSAFLQENCAKKLHLPALIGMLGVGILLGPHVFSLIDSSVLDISAQLRKIALVIILMRAGLSLNLADLKKVGRPAVLMCFVPACFEILGMTLLAPALLGISLADALVMGAVVGAVSPAVIVPKMLKLMEEKRGQKYSIPQLILAGASVDDVFVIVMFSVFTGLAQSGTVNALDFAKIPVSLILGIAAGILVGFILGKLMKLIHIRDTAKLLILVSVSFLLCTVEDTFGAAVPFSSLVAVMASGITINRIRPEAAERLSARFGRIWVAAEIVLFVLVGAAVDINYAVSAGISAVILIFAVLLFRMAGVAVCLIKTKIPFKQRLFCCLAYLPKATVQAAIGGVPLAMGLSCGNIVLTVAVLSIIITAPLGAFLIDLTYRKLLD